MGRAIKNSRGAQIPKKVMRLTITQGGTLLLARLLACMLKGMLSR